MNGSQPVIIYNDEVTPRLSYSTLQCIAIIAL